MRFWTKSSAWVRSSRCLQDNTISDILVNGHNSLCGAQGLLELTSVTFRDDQHLLRIIDKIVSQVGRRVDESTPMVDARLSDGSRVNAIIPPLALDGPLMSIRRFAQDKLTAPDLVDRKAHDSGMMELLEAAVKAKRTSSSPAVPDPEDNSAECAFGVHQPQRAHRHYRRCGRISVEAAARGAARNPACQSRR